MCPFKKTENWHIKISFKTKVKSFLNRKAIIYLSFSSSSIHSFMHSLKVINRNKRVKEEEQMIKTLSHEYCKNLCHMQANKLLYSFI